MIANIIKSYRDVIAICDSELLGKRFEEPLNLEDPKNSGENNNTMKQLHIKENFYKGKEGKQYDGNELLNLIQSFSKEDSTFNIVGKKSIQVALKSGIIKEDNIAKIQGIPYALVLM